MPFLSLSGTVPSLFKTAILASLSTDGDQVDWVSVTKKSDVRILNPPVVYVSRCHPVHWCTWFNEILRGSMSLQVSGS